MGRRMQPRSEKFVTRISTAGPNVVERGAMLTSNGDRQSEAAIMA